MQDAGIIESFRLALCVSRYILSS